MSDFIGAIRHWPCGDLAATVCELVPKDVELRAHAFEWATQKISNFHVIRRELEGKQGKGYRHELQFDVTFGDPLGCARLEQFMLSAGSAKCGLIVRYEPKAVQEELPGTRVDLSPDPQLPLVTEEKRQAVADMPEGEGSKALEDQVAEIARKRGRPRKDVQ